MSRSTRSAGCCWAALSPCRRWRSGGPRAGDDIAAYGYHTRQNKQAMEQAMSTLQKLQDLIQEKYKIDPATIDPDASMLEQGIDSLALAEFLFDIEDHFGIDFPDARTDVNSLAGLARVIDELKAAKGG
jgi:acyl carrier protein